MERTRMFFRLGLLVLALLTGGLAEAQGFRSTARIVVEPDREMVRALREARQNVANERFQAAASLYQFLLDRPEDHFLEGNFRDENGMAGGLRQDVVRQLMALPAAGRDAYELEAGARARQLVEAALKDDDMASLRTAVRRYLATSAGYAAAVRLAAAAADQGNPLQAALLMESIRNHPDRTPQAALERAVYWTRAGRQERGVAALKDLARQSPAARITLRGRALTVPADEEQAAQLLASLVPPAARKSPAVNDWTVPRGHASRNATASPASPVGGDVWQVSVIEHLALDGRPDVDRRHRSRIQETLDRIQRLIEEEDKPMLPASQPLVVGSTVVYRTPADLTAVDLATGELRWRSAIADESLIRFLSTRGTDPRVAVQGGVNAHAATLEGYLERRSYRDLTAGTLSSDGQTVFALEDLDRNFVAITAFGAPETRPANKLVAYDLAGGLLLWEVGGPRGTRPPDLSSLYFLGPPLPVEDRLYVIAEAQGDLKLLALVQDADRQSVAIDWSQTLIATDPPLTGHPLRRLSGLAPSLADGLLICPTSSGAVVAIDLSRRTLAWGFQYSSMIPAGFQNADPNFDSLMNQEYRIEEADRDGHWMDSTAMVVDGKVLLTPRDSDRLFCLDLVDGHELWTLPREDWLYVACVHEGTVVLVGEQGLGAVRLDDGSAVATFAGIDLKPTGRGVRIGHTYCLPTAAGELAAIDLRTGALLAQSRLTGNRIPGNLVAGHGAIVSQSAREVVGFAGLSAIEQQIARLGENPEDATGLALRGELKLHQGDEAGGLADLREALRKRPSPYVKSVLATALLAAVRNQPARVLDSVAELEAVADEPQTRNEFLRLYSRALESRGDRLGAFSQLIRLADTSAGLNHLQTVDAGYSHRADRDLRARLIDMSAAASEAERTSMNEALQQHLAAVETPSAELFGQQLGFFLGLPRAESLLLTRIQSSPALTADDRARLLPPLVESEEPAVAAQAAALLCQEHLRKGEKWQAFPLLKKLVRDFPDVVSLSGKTGQELVAEWTRDPQWKDVLTPPPVWPDASIDLSRSPREGALLRTMVPSDVISCEGDAFAGWSFETDIAGTLLVARDPQGRIGWKVPLPIDGEFNEPELRGVPLTCQIRIRGTWLVVSRLTFFVVLDASDDVPRVAWRQLLKASGASASDGAPQVRLGFPRPRPGIRSSGPLGQVVAITREAILYRIGPKLNAAEVATGHLVWTRQDLQFTQREITADDHTVALMGRGPGLAGPETLLVRTLDGAELAQRPMAPGGLLIWSRGARQLFRRMTASEARFEMRDVLHDKSLWTYEGPRETLVTLIDDEDLGFLEPEGQLVVVRLADRSERYRARLTITPPAVDMAYFMIQRTARGDLVLVGESYRHRASAMVPFESANAVTAPAFEGHVCLVDSSTGRLVWKTSVDGVAFDRTQPSELPVMLLASRQLDGRNAANPFLPQYRMRAVVIDKRTGLQVYATDELAPQLAPRLEPDPERTRILVNFHDWQLDLKYPESTAK